MGISISAVVKPYFSGLLHAIDPRLTQLQHSFMIGYLHEKSDLGEQLSERFLDWQMEGMITAPKVWALDEALPVVVRSGKPIVLVDRFVDYYCDQVASENTKPVHEVASHLMISNGRSCFTPRLLPSNKMSPQRDTVLWKC